MSLFTRAEDPVLTTIAEALAKLTMLIESGPHTEADRMLDVSPDGVLLVNRHGVISRANRRAEVLFWFPPGAMASMPVDKLIPEDVRSAHAANLAGYFNAPRTREMGVGMVLSGRRADGTTFPVEIALAPFQEPGADLLTMAVIRDKSERNEAPRSPDV